MIAARLHDEKGNLCLIVQRRPIRRAFDEASTKIRRALATLREASRRKGMLGAMRA